MTTFVGAGIDEEAAEPGVEPLDVPQAGKLSPRVHKRLLDGVLGALPVPKDQAGNGVQAVARGDRQGLEGLVIAVPRRLHVVALHRPLHPPRDLAGRATTLRRSPAREPFKNRVSDAIGEPIELRLGRSVQRASHAVE